MTNTCKTWLGATGAILVLFMFVMSFTPVVYAQGNPPLTPTLDYALQISAMQTQVSAISTRVFELDARISIQREAVETYVDRQYTLPIVLGSAAVAAIGIFFGLRTRADFDKKAEEIALHAQEEVRKGLGVAIAKVDPTYWTIRYASPLEEVKERLLLCGFQNLIPYTEIKNLEYAGIVVYDARAANDISDLEPLIQWLQLRAPSPDPRKLAVILYTTGHINKVAEVNRTFKNTTVANFPVTIATHIYALGRGMEIV